MNQELTPKQQAVELIRQANHILLVAGNQPNNDQLSAMVGLELILKRAGKQVNAIMTSELPKASKILDVSGVSRNLDGIRDFIIRLDTSNVEVDKLRYEVNDKNLEVVVSPYAGNFTAKDASFDYGAYKFDLVVVLGVSSISRIDNILGENPTIFDGLHLINIDCHRSNENYGSVNYVEPYASSVCEMLVGVMESVAQGMIDYHVATAVLTGIMSATQGFTAPGTTAKSLTIAAQMMSGGAKQQDIVLALFGGQGSGVGSRSSDGKTNNVEKRFENVAAKDKGERIKEKVESPAPEKPVETIAEKLARQGLELSQDKGEPVLRQAQDNQASQIKGVKDAKTGEIVEDKDKVESIKDKVEGTEKETEPKTFENPDKQPGPYKGKVVDGEVVADSNK